MLSLKDIDDSRPVLGIKWHLMVDRENAAKTGGSVNFGGQIVQFLTDGLRVGGYHPIDTDEEVDIHISFPHEYRNLDKLMDLRGETAKGTSALVSHVKSWHAPRLSNVFPTDGKRALNARADIKEDYLADDSG